MQKSIYALTLAAVLAMGATAARAQTVFSANFDSAGYSAGDYLTNNQIIAAGASTASSTGQNGWLTTDPENDNLGNANKYVGGSNYVLANSGYTSGNLAVIGGLVRNSIPNATLVPGAAVSSIYHTFTLAPGVGQGYQFDTDFVVNVAQGVTALTDRFAFVLQSGNNPLLTINFSPSTTASSATIGYAVGNAATTATVNGVTLNGTYHLTIQVNPVNNTYSASYAGNGVTLGIASGSLAAAGILPNSVDRVAGQWTLANNTQDSAASGGGYSGASTNSLFIDNYVVSYYNLVPEPSTYAAGALGLLTLIIVCKRRRQAC